MENASKALLIAGTILISIFIIGMFVYVFRAGGSLGETYDKKQTAEQLELYNSKFEAYTGKDSTIMDIISLFNLAYNVNESSNYDSQDTVEIKVIAGNQIFYISKDAPVKKANGEVDETTHLNRNEIFVSKNLSGEKKISIYDLTTKTLNDLNINTDGTEQLIVTKLSKQKATVYKYLFKNTEIKYEHQNGKVSSMKFEMIINNEYNNI